MNSKIASQKPEVEPSSSNKSREWIKAMAWVLKHKTAIPDSPDREGVLQVARLILSCGLSKKKSERILGQSWSHFRCRNRFCPRCQAKHSKRYKALFISQFTGYEYTGRLYEIRLSLGRGNVSGEHLQAAIDELLDHWDLLTRRTAWRKEIRRCGAIPHHPWMLETTTTSAGFWPHLHVLCFTSTKKPRLRRLAPAFRRILGLPKGTPVNDYFHVKKVPHLERKAYYFTKVTRRIPGYEPKKPKRDWTLMSMPDSDLLAFITAVVRRQRIFWRRRDSTRKVPPAPHGDRQ